MSAMTEAPVKFRVQTWTDKRQPEDIGIYDDAAVAVTRLKTVVDADRNGATAGDVTPGVMKTEPEPCPRCESRGEIDKGCSTCHGEAFIQSEPFFHVLSSPSSLDDYGYLMYNGQEFEGNVWTTV